MAVDVSWEFCSTPASDYDHLRPLPKRRYTDCKPDWKASPKLEEKPKKKPIPLPANRVPIHPERKPTISSKPTNVSSESDSSKSQAQPTSKPHPHSTRHHTLASTKRQPVAPNEKQVKKIVDELKTCLLYTSPSPRDRQKSRMPSSA